MRNTLALFLAIVMLLLVAHQAFAEMREIPPGTPDMSRRLLVIKEQTKGKEETKEKPHFGKKKITQSIKEEAENYDTEEQLQRVVDKADEAGNKIWLMMQAQTWPIFILGGGIGLAILVLGLILNVRLFKKTGSWLLFFAVGQLVLVNFAPEIAEGIIRWIGGLSLEV